MKIAVLMGGSSAERDASLENGRRIIAALEEVEHTSVAIDVSEDLVATLRAERPDMAAEYTKTTESRVLRLSKRGKK